MRSFKLFPLWREAWRHSDDLSRLLQEAEELLARRRQGNQRIPVVVEGVFERIPVVVASMRRWMQGEQPPPGAGSSAEIAKVLYGHAWAILTPAAWPRWLLLEHAFEDASETGDLHFAALVVRTMCEELQRLSLLDVDQARFIQLATSEKREEHQHCLEILACALANLKPLGLDFLEASQNDNLADRESELERVRSSLNDYVHPNYGSHVAALYPERHTAAHILLKAVVVTYREFFSLSWSEERLRGKTRPVPVQHLSWSRAAREVVSQNLPAAKSKIPGLEVTQLLGWLARPSDLATGILGSPEAVSLADELPEAIRSWDAAASSRGQPLAPPTLLFMALARRAASIITEEFPSGAPPVQDMERWLSFLAICIELITQLNSLKEETFKRQLVRQLAQGNPLAADLCIRSLIEHRATVMILPGRIANKWIEAARRFQSAESLPLAIKQMDNAISKLLAGQRSSVETLLPFATREDGAPIPSSLSLPTLIGEAFESGSPNSRTYAITSASIHGRTMRGADLLRDRAGIFASRTCLLGICVLDWICDPQQRSEYLYPAARVVFAAQHAARHIGGFTNQDIKKKRLIMGHYEGQFKPTKDYTGDGTSASPIVFRKHLFYYTALQRFLEQMKISPDGRQPVLSDQGRWCDRYRETDREWWFEVPDQVELH